MHIAKLRVRDENGFVPAGRYFEQISKNLRAANTREQSREAGVARWKRSIATAQERPDRQRTRPSEPRIR